MAKRSRKKRTPDSSLASHDSRGTTLHSAREPGRDALTFANLFRAFLIVAVGWWVFLPTLNGGWIWDDKVYLQQNPLLGDPHRLWKIWFQPGSFIEYYPIQETVQWAQCELFHDYTLGYHVTNIVLHLLSALLVWRLLDRFNLRLAWLGGLLFAVHPAVVESVAWMSEIKNTLSLLPFLMAACAYLDYDARSRKRDYWMALGWFLVAMLCKISMALFPIVILLHAWWKRRRVGWSDVKTAAPFLIISLVLGTTTIIAGEWFRAAHHLPPDRVEVGGFWSRVDLIGLLTSWYFYQVICPVTHSFFYPKWTVNPPSPLQFLPWLVFPALFYFLWTKRESWGRHVLLGVGFFLINLSPFLGLLLPSYMGFTWAMDHFLYLPIIGMIGLAVAGLELAGRKMPGASRSYGVIILTLVMAGLAIISHRYAGTFRDEKTLWANAAQYAPGSAVAHDDLGLALMQGNQLQEAAVQFHFAVQIEPGVSEIHDHHGQVLAQLGKLPDAMAEFDTAVRLNPNLASPYSNRGLLWQIKGEPDKALSDLSFAIELKPDMAMPYINRSVSRQITGDWEGALADLRQFCKLAPKNSNADYAHLWIWFIQSQHGQRAEADIELGQAMNNSWNGSTTDWSSRIGQFLLGALPEEKFLKFASAPNPDMDRTQRGEAWYFVGAHRLLAGDKTGAADAFRQCLATGDTQALTYALAKAELNLLQPH